MGWLKSLMTDCTPPVRSFGELARAALAHPEWPADDINPQPRSLAALFSKLDRGQELEWLADRPAVQHVLSAVLRVPRTALESHVGSALEEFDRTTHLLRLADAPFARPIDLVCEPLPPGIPEVVCAPPRWERLFWHAPSGAGRTLAGRWLEARSLATFLCASSLEEACARLPPTGPVFIELTDHAPPDRELLRNLGRRTVCVAASVSPPERELEALGFTRLESLPPSTQIDGLIRWVSARTAGGESWPLDRVSDWIRRALNRDPHATLGTALGLIGVLDELGFEEAERRSLDDLADRAVRARLSRFDGVDRYAEWFREHGLAVLSGLIRRLLSDSDEAWDAARSFDEWLRLLPPEYGRDVDAEWVRLSVARSASHVAVKELERALQKSPPGAFRTVEALKRADFLRTAPGADALSLGPRWLFGVLVERAYRELAQASVLEWGEALLRNHSAARVAAFVKARLSSGEPIDEPLELENDESPASTVALETCFRMAGLAVLEGAELPSDYLEALWDAQLDLLLSFDGLPHPRVAFTEGLAPELAHGAWLLAALAISEQLPRARGRRQLVLRPWVLSTAAPGLATVLDRIHSTVSSPLSKGCAWAIAAYFLAERLAARVKVATDHALLAPAAAWSALEQARLSWPLVEALRSENGVEALLGHAARKGEAPDRVFSAIWRAWERAGCPSSDVFQMFRDADALWRALPADVLERPAAARRVLLLRPRYECFSDAQHGAFLAAMGDEAPPADYFDFTPMAPLRSWLERRTPGEELARTLWVRRPIEVLDFLEGIPDLGPGAVHALLRTCPEGCTRDVVSRLRARPQVPVPVRVWLHERVAARHPGWQDAYALLTSLPRDAT